MPPAGRKGGRRPIRPVLFSSPRGSRTSWSGAPAEPYRGRVTTISARAERRLAPRHTAYVVLGGVVAALAAPVVWTLVGLATGLLVVVVGVVFAGLLLLLSEALTRWHRARAAALLGVVVDAPAARPNAGWRGPARPTGACVDLATARLPRVRRAAPCSRPLPGSSRLCWGGGLVLATSPLWARSPRVVACPAASSRVSVASGCRPPSASASCLAPRAARWLAALDIAIVRPMLGETRGEQLVAAGHRPRADARRRHRRGRRRTSPHRARPPRRRPAAAHLPRAQPRHGALRARPGRAARDATGHRGGARRGQAGARRAARLRPRTAPRGARRARARRRPVGDRRPLAGADEPARAARAASRRAPSRPSRTSSSRRP